jgi:protein-tyrosine-phosphatase
MAPRPVRLLFVCIGNTCRSPLAAAVASAILGTRVYAESAGITETGRPAASDTIAVLQERFGIDLTGHRSRHLDEVTVAEFDSG